jgi:hypothetical protein
MTEYVLSIDSIKFTCLLLIAVTIQFIAYRKFVFSIFDPLCLYLVNNSFTIAFVFYLFIDGEITNEAYLVSFLACNIAFALGMYFISRKFKLPKLIQKTHSKKEIHESIKVSKILYMLLYFIVIIVVLANVFLILQTGELPLLSSNPDSAKVVMRQDGLGIVYRVNNILLPLGISICLFKMFSPIPILKSVKSDRLILLGLLTILVLFFISGGSKGVAISLLGFFVPCQIFNKYFNSRYIMIINKIMFSLLPIGLISALVVFVKNSNEVKYLDPLQGLMVRLVANGDAFYYFYKYDLIKKINLNIFDYIVDSLNPLLSLIKIATYDTPFGEKLLIESINLTTGGFGPNAPYQIYGLAYFGFIGSCIFSFFIGCIISLVRTRFLSWTLERPNELNMVVYTTCFYNIMSLPVDYVGFLTILYSSIIFITPVVIVSRIFTINDSLLSVSDEKD